MNDKRIKENDFSSAKELEEYLRLKAKNHKHYKYYAKRDYISTIFDSHSVYLSNGKNWNDKVDSASLAKSPNQYRYALCLSYSKSESVAMWLLYSGNDGCMIDYDRKTIESILDSACISLGEFQNNVFYEKEMITKPNFVIEISDVVYYGENKDNLQNKYYVKRSDEVNDAFDRHIIDELTYQKKKCAWSYENECRIIVSIDRNTIKEEYPTAKVTIPESSLQGLAKKRTYDSPNSQSVYYNQSKLSNELNWNLCRKCEKRAEAK